MLSAREVAKSARSLICMLQALIGKRVRIELRNDTYIVGTLQDVDSFMNTEICDAYICSIYARLDSRLDRLLLSKRNESRDDVDQVKSPNIIELTIDDLDESMIIEDDDDDDDDRNSQSQLDYMFIKGSRIRYFHIPKDVDIFDCIEQQLAALRNRKSSGSRPTTTSTTRPFNWKSYRKRQKLEQMQIKVAQKGVPTTSTTSTPSTSATAKTEMIGSQIDRPSCS